MDYPAPYITWTEAGGFDFGEVYEREIGEWDKVGVAYGYQDFPDGADESEALQVILAEAWAQDLKYMSNQDMSAHPRVNQWSNGNDPAAELNRMMEVRRAALDRFGERNIKLRQPATRFPPRPRRSAASTTSTHCAVTAVHRLSRYRVPTRWRRSTPCWRRSPPASWRCPTAL